MTAAKAAVTDVVRVGSLRLRVQRSGEGPPLLLINGIGAAIEMWRPAMARLTDREVIAFDLPGSGESSLPVAPLRMPALARTVARLLDELDLPDADVLGYSFGGLVAQELAYRHPDRVRRLVLCATGAGFIGRPPNPLIMALMLTPTRYYSRSLGAAIVPRISGGRTARDPETLGAGLELRQINPPSRLGYTHQLLATLGWTSQRWLGRLRQEVLVVHGDDDPLAPLANAQMLARRIPRARLVVIRGGGHLFMIDDVDRALPAITHFLEAGVDGTRPQVLPATA